MVATRLSRRTLPRSEPVFSPDTTHKTISTSPQLGDPITLCEHIQEGNSSDVVNSAKDKFLDDLTALCGLTCSTDCVPSCSPPRTFSCPKSAHVPDAESGHIQDDDEKRRKELVLKRSIARLNAIASALVQNLQNRASVGTLLLKPQECDEINLVMPESIRLLLIDTVQLYFRKTPKEVQGPLKMLVWQCRYQLGFGGCRLETPFTLTSRTLPCRFNADAQFEDEDGITGRSCLVSKPAYKRRRQSVFDFSDVCDWTRDHTSCCYSLSSVCPPGSSTSTEEQGVPSSKELGLIVSALVKFLRDNISAGSRVLQPGFCNEVRRLIPKSSRKEFWDALQYCLNGVPEESRMPLELLTLRCRYQLGLDGSSPKLGALPSPSQPSSVTAVDVSARKTAAGIKVKLGQCRAACYVQRSWRGYRTRLYMAEARATANNIQATYRKNVILVEPVALDAPGHAGSRVHARKESILASRRAVTVIKALYRGLVARRWSLTSRNDFQFVKCSVITLCSLLRQKLRCMESEIQICAAICIQSTWRRKKSTRKEEDVASFHSPRYSVLLHLPALVDEEEEEGVDVFCPPSLVSFVPQINTKLEEAGLRSPSAPPVSAPCYSPLRAAPTNHEHANNQGLSKLQILNGSEPQLLTTSFSTEKEADLLSPICDSGSPACWSPRRSAPTVEEKNNRRSAELQILCNHDQELRTTTSTNPEDEEAEFIPPSLISFVKKADTTLEETRLFLLSPTSSSGDEESPRETAPMLEDEDDLTLRQQILSDLDRRLQTKKDSQQSTATTMELKTETVIDFNFTADSVVNNYTTQDCGPPPVLRVAATPTRHNRMGSLAVINAGKDTIQQQLGDQKREISILQALIRRQILAMKHEIQTRAAKCIQRGWRLSVARVRRPVRSIQAFELYLERYKATASTLIQTSFRRYLVQAKYIHAMHSAVLIQNWARGRISKQRYQYLRYSATKAQAFIRMALSPKLTEAHRAAVVIQGLMRPVLAAKLSDVRRHVVVIQSIPTSRRKRFHLLRRGTVTVQTIARGFLTSKFVETRQSAAAIQSAWRGHFARKCYQSTRLYAIKAQAFIRGSLAPKFSGARRSAILIQSLARAHCARARYKSLRKAAATKVFIEESLSAATIQSVARRYLAREHYQNIRRATILLQTFFRGLLAPELADVRRSTVLIQIVFRRHFFRKDYQCRRRTANARRVAMRGASSQGECAQRMKTDFSVEPCRLVAARDPLLIIQAVVRGWLCRKNIDSSESLFLSCQSWELDDNYYKKGKASPTAVQCALRTSSAEGNGDSASIVRTVALVRSHAQKYQERRAKLLLLPDSQGLLQDKKLSLRDATAARNQLPELGVKEASYDLPKIKSPNDFPEPKRCVVGVTRLAMAPRLTTVVLGLILSFLIFHQIHTVLIQFKSDKMPSKDRAEVYEYLHRISEHIQASAVEPEHALKKPLPEEEPELFLSYVIAQALVVRAEVHLRALRYPEALRDVREALLLGEPSVVGTAFRIGAKAYSGLGKFQEAEQYVHLWAAGDLSWRGQVSRNK